ncbi:hypothetical protein I601_2040 [Nocardioides dokdonensis FR1436]|uniref:Uncharacterized protein n=1 Tax=Nocardioides dokdonensis FR1436 TaxID=1300347 RepID=A0A1A9GJM3_9ACTN|nr:hypothetical protein [Nocardioides dokdonensis]ANH38468.1 hypothetical protein I601_2040 [Nocardioides dokdonensis FR1436]
MSQGQQDREQERKQDKQRDADEKGAADEGGQVSEVQNMEGAGEPISDDQSVAGQPDAESGRVDEGPTGPNARSGSNEN